MGENYNLDHDRKRRLGFPETVYGRNKDIDSLLKIAHSLFEKNGKVLITQVQPEKMEVLKRSFDDVFYDPASSLCRIGKIDISGKPKEVAVLSGGTSDEYVVNEAFHSLEYLGIGVKRYQDIGVSALHRLLKVEEELRTYKVLIVVAGFEGALPTVVGGLLPMPIIAVPVSVGYGVAHGGMSALNSMLASCANGITVVNIDNGYGAALAAFRILSMAK